jgi:hypothetical protein
MACRAVQPDCGRLPLAAAAGGEKRRVHRGPADPCSDGALYRPGIVLASLMGNPGLRRGSRPHLIQVKGFTEPRPDCFVEELPGW